MLVLKDVAFISGYSNKPFSSIIANLLREEIDSPLGNEKWKKRKKIITFTKMFAAF